MKYIRSIGFVFCALLTLSPVSLALASPVLRSGESVTVSDAQEVPSDFYAVGGTVTISGTIAGDLYAAGGTVTVNGDIAQDVVIAGGSVRVDGSVGDDIRIIGGELVIAGTIEGDVLVIGGIMRILSTARIKGDVLFLGGEINMDGDLRGSLSGHGETVRINGPVLGNVSVTSAQALELGDQAHVEGTIAYTSMKDIVRAPGSVVTGDITKKESIATAGSPLSRMLPLLALFFTTLVYLVVCKRKLGHLMRHTVQSFGYHGLLGFGVVVLIPIVAIVLMISAIGLAVGITLLLFCFLLLIVASSLVGIFLGAILARYFEGEVTISLKWALLGTLALAIMLQIPYAGLLLIAVADAIVIGGISSVLYRRLCQ